MYRHGIRSLDQTYLSPGVHKQSKFCPPQRNLDLVWCLDPSSTPECYFISTLTALSSNSSAVSSGSRSLITRHRLTKVCDLSVASSPRTPDPTRSVWVPVSRPNDESFPRVTPYSFTCLRIFASGWRRTRPSLSETPRLLQSPPRCTGANQIFY